MIKLGSFTFRPTLIGSIAAGLALALLLGLGVWQLQRLAWKTALIAELAERAQEQAIVLPPAFLPEEMVYRRVYLSGRFLPGRELRSAPRVLSKRPGLYVYTPFELDDGRQIIVERGWLPQRFEDPTSRPQDPSEGGLPEGRLAFDAMLLREGWQGSEWLRPANDPAKNVWHYVDSLEMAAAAGLELPVSGVYAAVLPEQLPGEYPLARRPGVDLRNDHLEYAITWFALAGILLVIYAMVHVRRDRG